MEVQHSQHELTAFVTRSGTLRGEPFSLLDVGCSHGLDAFWRTFEPHFAAWGIDPMPAECKRLQGLEKNPLVSYHPYFFGLPAEHPFMLKRGNRPLRGYDIGDRLSFMWAVEEERKRNPAPTHEEILNLNEWNRSSGIETVATIDPRDFVNSHGVRDLDFLKIDIDGHDMEVLVGLEDCLDQFPVLAVALEVNFQGTEYETDHTFHNMDRLMRRHRFDLFSLSTRSYSRRALPSPFCWNFPAQTLTGQPWQGDAIYVRDLASPRQADVAAALSPAKILKTACIFELVGLPDCAAELLLAMQNRLGPIFDVPKALDALTPTVDGRKLRYRDYLALFPSRRDLFYCQQNGTAEALRAQLADAKAALAAKDAELENLRAGYHKLLTAHRHDQAMSARPLHRKVAGKFLRMLGLKN